MNKTEIEKKLRDLCQSYLKNEISEKDLSKLVDEIKYKIIIKNKIEISDINLIRIIDICSEIEFLHLSNPRLSQAEKEIKNFVFPKK